MTTIDRSPAPAPPVVGPAPGLAVAAPTRLRGIAHYFPGEPVGNDFFEAIPALGIDDAWIQRSTGVRSRHWPEEDGGERAVEMGARAVEVALDRAGLQPEDVDLVVGTTSTTRPRVNPSSATNRYMDISLPLQAQAGLVNATCFDVTAVACAGFLYGSAVAASLMPTLGMRNALVVCAENPRPILNFNYRYSALFGAGAAAAVWTSVPTDGAGPGANGTPAIAGPQLIDVVLHADGTHFDAFDIDDDDKMLMKGKQVGDLGPRLLGAVGTELLERNGLTVDDVAWFVPHQGNLNMIRQVCAALDVPLDRVLTNIESRGNTSSVSIPSCLSENLAAGRIRTGDLVVAIGIGRGFSWGGMLLRA